LVGDKPKFKFVANMDVVKAHKHTIEMEGKYDRKAKAAREVGNLLFSQKSSSRRSSITTNARELQQMPQTFGSRPRICYIPDITKVGWLIYRVI
jgi:hypothetical protein